MNKKIRYSLVGMLFTLFVFGYAAGPVYAQDKNRGLLAGLASFGFYVLDTPAELNAVTFEALKGASVSNKDFQGNITFLNFWATWCPPCRAEMPSIERLYAATKGTRFKIVAVSAGETRKRVSDFIEKNKYTFPIFLDESGRLSAAFIRQGIPSTYILNKEGKIIAFRPGAMEYDNPKIIKLFKELADG